MFYRWLAFLIGSAIAIAMCSIGPDLALADIFHRFPVLQHFLKAPVFKLPLMQLGALGLLVWGALAGDFLGNWADAHKTAIQAGLAMICAMGANILLFKPLFGRTVPWMYFAHGEYGFHPFHRDVLLGSFPSGHAVLATALATVFWMAYPKGRPLYLVALSILGLALLAGEFHFLSDLIAGGFVGATGGLGSVMAVNALAARNADHLPAQHFLDEGVVRALRGAAGAETAENAIALPRVRMSQKA